MTYQELIIKLIEIQKHMMPDLEKFEREGRLPHDLKVAKAEIIEWEHTVDGDGGLEEAPEIWPWRSSPGPCASTTTTSTTSCAATSPSTRPWRPSCPRPTRTRSANRHRSRGMPLKSRS